MDKTEFITETGSRYEIDRVTKKWYRFSKDKNVRTSSGEYFTITDITVGKSVVLFGPPLNEGIARMITTSRVTAITE